MERLKQQIAAELQAQLAASSGGVALTQQQLGQIAADAEAKAAAEAARLEAAAKAAEAEAARYERKQKQVQEKIAKAAEASEQLHQQKEELAVSAASSSLQICHEGFATQSRSVRTQRLSCPTLASI